MATKKTPAEEPSAEITIGETAGPTAGTTTGAEPNVGVGEVLRVSNAEYNEAGGAHAIARQHGRALVRATQLDGEVEITLGDELPKEGSDVA